MILADVALIAAPTFRSRAYAQALAASELLPQTVLHLPGPEPSWDGPDVVSVEGVPGFPSPIFRPAEPHRLTLAAAPRLVELPSGDVNDARVVEMLSNLSERILIYAGRAGVILRGPAVACGKRVLHVHGGFAPTYRGSTAFYYSLLAEGSIGVTALWLAEPLDAGDIVARRSFIPPPGLEIDRIVDPVARAGLLIEVLQAFVRSGRFPESSVDAESGRMYYVIHPVMKHLAMRRAAAAGRTSS